MIVTNYSTFRSNMKSFCDKACEDQEIVLVTRKGDKNVVMLSLDRYNELAAQQGREKGCEKNEESN